MADYAAIGFDHPPHSMGLRDQHRDAHRRYVLDHDGPIRMAGAMTDDEGNQCGTIYVFSAESEEEIWSWLRAEPFFAAGVYQSVRIVKWTPAFNRIESRSWPVGAVKG